MGNNNFKLTKLALALGLTASLTACFSDNDDNKYEKPPVKPPETVVVAVPPAAAEVQAGAITVSLVDVQGNQLVDTTATIKFTSPEDGLVTSAGAELSEENKSTTASLFAFNVSAIPADGIDYSYVVTAEGYLSNSGTFSLTAEETSLAQEIRLTPRTLPDSDVAVVAATTALADLAEEGTDVAYDESTGLVISGDKSEIELKQEISGDKASTAVGGTTVKLKSGTKFIKKDGTAMTTVPEMTVAYFANEATRNTTESEEDAAESSSLDAFPGGLALSVAGPDNDETVEGSFTSGGFVAIELVDDEGNKVSTFGEDENGNPIALTVAMQVDKNTNNPCPVVFDENSADSLTAQAEAGGYKKGVCTVATPTSRDLKANDIFPVWSYDEDAGEWEFENYGVVKDSGNATTFDVEVDVEHLSYWNLDYFTYRIGASKCPNNRLTFNIVDQNDDPNEVRSSLLIEANGYRSLIRSYGGNYDSGTFRNPPSFPVKIKMMRDGKNILDGVVGQASADGESSAVEFDDLCDLQGQTIKLNSAPVTIVEKQITTQLVCSNTEDFEVATAPVVTPTNVNIYQNGKFVRSIYSSGTFSLKLEEGGTYTASYEDINTGDFISTALTADASATTFDIPTVCEVEEVEATGSGSGS